MCELCWTDAIEIGFLPNSTKLSVFLARKTHGDWHKDEYALILNGTSCVVFDTPVKDNDDEDDSNLQEHILSVERAERTVFPDIVLNHDLYVACVEAGYMPKEHGERIMCWIVDKVCEVIDGYIQEM